MFDSQQKFVCTYGVQFTKICFVRKRHLKIFFKYTKESQIDKVSPHLKMGFHCNNNSYLRNERMFMFIFIMFLYNQKLSVFTYSWTVIFF